MKTVHVTSRRQLSELTSTIQGLLDDGKTLAVTVAEEDELLSPGAAAERLGFSRQHVRRLVDAGELVGARGVPNRGSDITDTPEGVDLCLFLNDPR